MATAGWQIVNHLRAQRWVEVPATLESVALEESSAWGEDGSPSRLRGSYRYEFGGWQYESHRLSFSLVYAANLDDGDERLARKLGEAGDGMAARVNPDDPVEGVVLADILWGEVGAAALFALCMGAGGLVLTAMAGARRGRPLFSAPAGRPAVKGWVVMIMLATSPVAGLMAGLLWRDGHPIWAGLVAMHIALALHAAARYLRQRKKA